MSTLEELITMIGQYMPSLSNLPVYIIGFTIVTILLAVIFTGHRWIKFIPGLVSLIYGLYIGKDAWEYFARDGALEQAWKAIIYVVSGIVSICVAFILHMYIAKKKKNKKSSKKKNNTVKINDQNYTIENPKNTEKVKNATIERDDRTKVISRKKIDDDKDKTKKIN